MRGPLPSPTPWETDTIEAGALVRKSFRVTLAVLQARAQGRVQVSEIKGLLSSTFIITAPPAVWVTLRRVVDSRRPLVK